LLDLREEGVLPDREWENQSLGGVVIVGLAVELLQAAKGGSGLFEGKGLALAVVDPAADTIAFGADGVVAVGIAPAGAAPVLVQRNEGGHS
jgi:hypothetical protein